MTRARNILATIACMLGMVMFTTSCEHKDLCYHHPHMAKIYVEFNWQNAPDANPLGMCVFFYPEDGGDPVGRTCGCLAW